MKKVINNKKPFYNSEIPCDWYTPYFAEAFMFLKSFSFSREDLTYEKSEDELQNIHYGDIHKIFENEILDFEYENRIPFIKHNPFHKKELENPDFPFLKDGDLIIADASEDYEGICKSVELKNINNRRVVSGLHTFALRDKKAQTVAGFRSYVLKNQQVIRELRRIATGISVYGVSKTNLAKVKIPLPPIPEQKTIAKVLSLQDEMINKTNQLITQKEQQKKWLMQQLLTGKKRLKGFEEVWSELTLDNITKRVIRRNKELNDNVVTISAQRGFVRQEDFFNKRVASETLANYYLVNKGEFAYNKSYSNGYPMGAFKRLEKFEKAVVTTLYICFGIKGNTNSNFIKYYFDAGLMIPGLMRIAQEGGRAHGLLNISLGDFFSLKLTIPELKEQEAIASILQTADKEIEILKNKLSKLKEQKKGMMQVLLTGKKRLKIEN